MSKTKTSGIDVIRRVWLEEYEPLTVQPSGDCPGYVQLSVEGKEAVEFWGAVDLQMPADMARLLGLALIACATDSDGEAA